MHDYNQIVTFLDMKVTIIYCQNINKYRKSAKREHRQAKASTCVLFLVS